jgi:hypothetical protein
VAWTVDPDGDLVVVAGRRPLDDPGPGRTEIIVSTYGLDDAAFGERRDAWTKRWAPVAAGAEVTTADTPAPQR